MDGARERRRLLADGDRFLETLMALPLQQWGAVISHEWECNLIKAVAYFDLLQQTGRMLGVGRRIVEIHVHLDGKLGFNAHQESSLFSACECVRSSR